MATGTVLISHQMIRQALQLPPETIIREVRQTWEHRVSGIFEVLIDSPEIQPVPEGSVYPMVRVEVHTDFCPDHEHSCIMGSRIMA